VFLIDWISFYPWAAGCAIYNIVFLIFTKKYFNQLDKANKKDFVWEHEGSDFPQIEIVNEQKLDDCKEVVKLASIPGDGKGKQSSDQGKKVIHEKLASINKKVEPKNDSVLNTKVPSQNTISVPSDMMIKLPTNETEKSTAINGIYKKESQYKYNLGSQEIKEEVNEYDDGCYEDFEPEENSYYQQDEESKNQSISVKSDFKNSPLPKNEEKSSNSDSIPSEIVVETKKSHLKQ